MTLRHGVRMTPLSLSSWRAWIEITREGKIKLYSAVALLMESVD